MSNEIKHQKIIDSLPAEQRKSAQDLAMLVNDNFAAANQAAEKAIMYYLKTGKALLEARTIFPGDNEYGKWRKENTTISSGWAAKLIRVAETYGDKPPAGIPVSTLAELTYLSESKRKELEERENPPSVREVKTAAKEERAEQIHTPTPTVPDSPIETMPRAMRERIERENPTLSLEQKAQNEIDQVIQTRAIVFAKSEQTLEDAFILFGLPPFCEGFPNPETVAVIYTGYCDLYEEHGDVLNAAYGIIMGVVKS